MKILLLIAFLALTDGRYFRNDYTYYSNAEGWLKYHEMPATWDEARLRCFFEGSVLASPLHQDLSAAMQSAMNNNYTEYVFTGISATLSNGDYFSIEGVALESIPHTWEHKLPENVGGEHCIAMKHEETAALTHVSCSQPLPYICYKKYSQSIPTGSFCGTVDPEYNFETRTGQCYKFHRFGQTWSKAFMACAAEGGHLAVINNDLEAQVLKELMSKYPGGKVMAKHKDIIGVGYHDWSQHGVFMTVHGQTLAQAGYEKWAGGQPDNATTGEYCGSIFRDALLNDIWCEDTIPFICEKPPGNLIDHGCRNSCGNDVQMDPKQGHQ